jgi:cytochrome P450
VTLTNLLSTGLFSTDGTEHKAQRRALFPSFSSQSAKSWIPHFARKAEELCEQWKMLMHKEYATSEHKPTSVVIDVVHWTSRASFDVMGLTTFDHDFHAVQDDSGEVYAAYRRIFNIIEKGFGLKGLLELYFPVLSRLCVSKI